MNKTVEKLASRIQAWRQSGTQRTPLAEALDYMEFFISETQPRTIEQPVQAPYEAFQKFCESHLWACPCSANEAEIFKAGAQWQAAKTPEREIRRGQEVTIAQIEAIFRPQYNSHEINVGEMHMVRKVLQALYDIEDQPA